MSDPLPKGLTGIGDEARSEATRAHLTAIVDSSDDAIISTDLDGRILSWNRGAEHLYGYAEKEAVGQLVTFLLPPQVQVVEPRILQRAFSGERVKPYETVRRHKNGNLIDVSLSVSPIWDGKGHVMGASKIARNITQQKLAQHRDQQLFKLATAVNRAHALPDLFEQALHAIMESLNTTRASILLLDSEGIMRFNAWRGLSDGYRRAVEGHSPWKPEATTVQPIMIGEVETNDLAGEFRNVLKAEEIRALAFIPLMYGGRLIGKFMVYFPEPRFLDKSELQLAQAIADTLALGIERRRTEEIVTQRENQLRQALEAGRMGTWEWDLVTNKVLWSSQLEAIHGLSPGSFSGSFEAYQHDIHPEDRARVLATIAKTMEMGTEHHLEYRIVLPDGSERWVEGKGTLSRTPEGIATKMVGVCSDITERKRAEEKLRASERLMRAVFNQQFAFSALLAPTGEIVRFSQSVYRNNEGTNIRPHDLIGTNFLEAPWWDGLPDTVAEWRRQIAEALDRRGPARGESPYRLANGEQRYAMNTVTALRDDHGNLEYLLCEGMDITQLKQSQLGLKESADELERQVAVRTAELVETQNHLRALATELNLAEQRERQRLATELHDHLQQTLVLGKLQLGHAKRLLQNLPQSLDVIKQFDDVLTEALTYTRTLIAELSPPVLRDHGLPAALRWLAEYMGKHGLRVEVNVPEHLRLSLPEDQAVLLFQSVRELLINAAKHAGTDQAWVTLKHDRKGIVIDVRDDGRGYDGSRPTSPNNQSSKFGLFSIRERMNALGGSFTIESAPGSGTTAMLYLPASHRVGDRVHFLEDVIDSISEPAISSLPTHIHSAVIRLLLVDDHAMVRQGLRTMLEHYADIHLVGEAKDGQEAVALVDTLHPHVVIMDINMPGLSGIEATSCIKARHPDICVIGISVNAATDNQEAMRRAGATQLIPKEAAVAELYHAIRRGLGLPPLPE
ncbi:MAG: PAS domain S-box protein [Nitrospira sp.]|nr:PAS domain S-box protein [Nitrospira sp.]